MRELLRTSDPVLVSFVEALLREAGVELHVADVHVSVVEGSIGIFPRRVLVLESDLDVARAILRDAGLASELPDAAAETSAPVEPRIGKQD